MRFRPQSSIAQERLILLYVISRIGTGIEHEDVLRLVMDRGWMTYLEMEQFLLDMVQDNLVELLDYKGRRIYSITGEGLRVLRVLRIGVPHSTREYIDRYMEEHRQSIRGRQEIIADFTQIGPGEYAVHLVISEDHRPLLELNLGAAHAQDAQDVCERFRAQAPQLYADLIAQLSRPPEPADTPQ